MSDLEDLLDDLGISDIDDFVAQASPPDTPREFVVCWNPTLHEYHNTFIKFFKNSSYADMIQEYVRKGAEINGQLRTGASSSTNDFAWRFDRVFSDVPPLGDLFPQLPPHGDMIKVYRTSRQPYTPDMAAGYMSTATRPLPFSEHHLLKIFIPRDAHVLIWDISQEVSDSGSTAPTYEVILPRHTQLYSVPEADNTFIVLTPFSTAKIDMLVRLAQTC